MDSQQTKLFHRIQRRFSVAHREILLGGARFEYIAVADEAEVFALIDERSLKDRPEFQPYWAQAWESTIGLCDALAATSLDGLQVLDIGCGLGLLGVYAASRGAHVVMADAVPSAMLFAQYNAWPYQSRTNARTIDWRFDRLDQRFDLIAGADIVYDRTDWQVLFDFWSYHLKPGGRVLLAEPKRHSGAEFCDWMQDKNWSVSESRLEVTERNFPIRLFELQSQL
jgi:predicted nicotinamide N-methyase